MIQNNIFIWIAVYFGLVLQICSARFLIGRGICDVTGLIAEGNLYGYGRDDHDARGMHSRQYARTFIICDVSNARQCVVIVTAEITMSTQSLNDQVMDELAALYGDMYTMENVMITATHSHATPGGMNTYWMYTKPVGGVIMHTFNIYVRGIVESIRMAHEDLNEGSVLYNRADLLSGFTAKIPNTLVRYAYDVDKLMHVLKMTRPGEDLGMFNLFPVHATSMRNTNHLVSSDNKGYASQMFERTLNPDTLPGQGNILGAFAQSAEGDVTPNIEGDFCRTSGERCHYRTSTCIEDIADPTLCNSRGPSEDMFASTKIIGERQYLKAMEIYRNAQEEITGSVDFRHTWVDMPSLTIDDQKRTCKPAMGYSFPAGATDGPGVRPFTQAGVVGGSVTNAAIDWLIGLFLSGSQDLRDCQAPKPIAIPSGEMTIPFQWQPSIIPMQLFKIGSVYLVGVAAEFTTMAGRRLTESIEARLVEQGVTTARVLLVGLSNGYTGYVTTREEYNVQRYEGAATAYGPHTLEGYLLKYNELISSMISGTDIAPSLPPPDMRGLSGEALGAIATDNTPRGKDYGDVIMDAMASYSRGDTVTVTFVAGNPRAAAEMEDNTASFLEIQRYDERQWTTVYNDASWETRFNWNSNCHDLSLLQSLFQLCSSQQESTATIQWYIPATEVPGQYRIEHSGYAKNPTGAITAYSGVSSLFTVY